MLAQAIPIGVNLASPVAWFVIAVGLIVLALAATTRRANTRPRLSTSGVAFQPPAAAAPAPAAARRPDYSSEWSAAQALFVENPRAGCDRARAIVTELLQDRGAAAPPAGPLARRYQAGCGIAARPDSSTDELRAAFIDFRAVSDALLGAR